MRHLLASSAEAEQTGLNETHHHFAVIKGGRRKGFGPGQKFPVFSVLTNQASFFVFCLFFFLTRHHNRSVFFLIFHFPAAEYRMHLIWEVKCV